MPLVPEGLVCQNNAAHGADGSNDAEKRCGCILDKWGDHIVICSRGGGMYRAHGGIVKLIAEFARDAGAWVEEVESGVLVNYVDE